MRIIDRVTLDAFARARPTITRYHGVDYVYLLEKVASPVRSRVKHGKFTLDKSWQPVIPTSGQTAGGSLIVMNNWIVGATNTPPSAAPLIVFAVSQSDGKVISTQPYVGDPVAPELAKAFAQAATVNGLKVPAISWADMSLEADPQNHVFYGVETLARKIAAFRITDQGIQTVWKQTQTTDGVGHADRSAQAPASGSARTSPEPRSPERTATTWSSGATRPRVESSRAPAGSRP